MALGGHPATQSRQAPQDIAFWNEGPGVWARVRQGDLSEGGRALANVAYKMKHAAVIPYKRAIHPLGRGEDWLGGE